MPRVGKGSVEIHGAAVAEIRRRSHLTQREFADAIGVSEPRVRQIEKAPAASLRMGAFRKLASFCGETPDQLERRIGTRPLNIAPGIPLSEDGDFMDSRGKIVNVVKPQLQVRYVPIINAIAAGSLVEHTDLGYPAGIADESLPMVGGENCFALWVIGDSMRPRYEPGDLVVFKAMNLEEEKIVSGGDYAIQLTADGNLESTFKRVRLDKSRKDVIIAEAINPDFKPHRTTIECGKIARMGRAIMIVPAWKDVRHR
jgi:SOS-response transcriptional repressor LexA